MIKIHLDNMTVFFEFESSWLGSMMYIGNNKFYLKYKTADGTEDNVIFTAKNYMDAIQGALSFISEPGGRIGRACQMTTEMICQGLALRGNTNMA